MSCGILPYVVSITKRNNSDDSSGRFPDETFFCTNASVTVICLFPSFWNVGGKGEMKQSYIQDWEKGSPWSRTEFSVKSGDKVGYCGTDVAGLPCINTSVINQLVISDELSELKKHGYIVLDSIYSRE